MPTAITRRAFLKTNTVAAASLLAGPAVLTGTDAPPSVIGRKPNLLFVMADQWRRQAMGYAGEDRVSTPHFDRFAADSLVFNQSCATRPMCAPSRACLLTGLYPQHHQYYANGLDHAMNPALPTMGNFFKDAGYRTSYVGKLHIGGAPEEFGQLPDTFRNQWDHWALAVGHRVFEQPYYLNRETKPTVFPGWAPGFETDQTIAFIRENRDKPFAAVLSWGPPHTSSGRGLENRWQPGKMNNGVPELGHGYVGPADDEAAYIPITKNPRRPNVKPLKVPGGFDDSDNAMAGYYGACTALDASFGKLVKTLQELGLYDNTLIVFTSDHGEMMGSQGQMQKGYFYEESIGVPLLLRMGDQLPVRRVDNLISTIDLLPTMLGLAGVKHSAKLDGLDCSSFARGQKPDTTDALFLSYDAGGGSEAKNLPDIAPNPIPRGWRTIRTERYSYTITESARIHTGAGIPVYSFYDIALDPCQMNPITGGRHQPIIDDLHNRLVAHLDQLGDRFYRG